MRNKQKGFSLIELLIVVAIILIIAAIAIPNLLAARMSANEASAVGSMRTLNTASISYSTTYGAGFPATLANLGPAAVASAATADLIDETLAGGTKSGYNFSYVPGAPGGDGLIYSYTVNGNPAAAGQTGQRFFYTDQTGVITFAYGVAAGPGDVPLS
jgi:type IV pilus assembly protein PilA